MEKISEYHKMRQRYVAKFIVQTNQLVNELMSDRYILRYKTITIMIFQA